MGLISELLEHDTDGRLKRLLLRLSSAIGYVIVVSVVLFSGGVIWRMYTGSEVEIFGLRVAGSKIDKTDKDEDEGKTAGRKTGPAKASTVPEPKTDPSPPPSAITAATTPPAPPKALTSTAWAPIAGDFEACVQAAMAAAPRAGMTAVERNTHGLKGEIAANSPLAVDVTIRCMALNGYSLALSLATSPKPDANLAAVNAINREIGAITGAPLVETLGGGVEKMVDYYRWFHTSFPNAEACRKHAHAAHDKLKPDWKREDRPGIFSRIGNVRATTICLQEGNRVSAMIAVYGFSRDEATRVREALASDFAGMTR